MKVDISSTTPSESASTEIRQDMGVDDDSWVRTQLRATKAELDIYRLYQTQVSIRQRRWSLAWRELTGQEYLLTTYPTKD